jgi:hypothetical protein
MSRHATRISRLTPLLCAASFPLIHRTYGAEYARDDEASARKAYAEKARQACTFAFAKDEISLPGVDRPFAMEEGNGLAPGVYAAIAADRRANKACGSHSGR